MTYQPTLTQKNHTFLKDLYIAVDTKSVTGLAHFLSNEVVFQLGNHDPIQGKQAVLAANVAFFDSITSMSHEILSIWEHGDTLICSGTVSYIRLDGSGLSLPFATILTLKAGLITHYQVYVDVSPL